MDYFEYKQDDLYAEEVDLASIADRFGTPCYVYSRATIERHWRAFDQALADQDHLVCYAVKANSNLAVLNLMARLGSGFDIVSGGELERVLAAGGDPAKILFSGLGKSEAEIQRALEVGIHCFNIESEPELDRINEIAGRLGVQASIALRVNPDVDAGTHPYISTGLRENKFGIDVERALQVYRRAAELENIQIKGIDSHIGSQLTTIEPFTDALERVLSIVDSLAEMGIHLEHLDLGGGLGITYKAEDPPNPAAYSQAILKTLGSRSLKIYVEPGRAIVGNAGVLLTRVEYLKPTAHKNFAIVDAAMNDLLRPALYQAWQSIVPAHRRQHLEPSIYDVVGPVCETADFLGKDRKLALEPNDLLAVRSSGAYAFAMSSNYNSRPRVAEVMVDGSEAHLIRERETTADLFALERCLADD